MLCKVRLSLGVQTSGNENGAHLPTLSSCFIYFPLLPPPSSHLLPSNFSEDAGLGPGHRAGWWGSPTGSSAGACSCPLGLSPAAEPCTLQVSELIGTMCLEEPLGAPHDPHSGIPAGLLCARSSPYSALSPMTLGRAAGLALPAEGPRVSCPMPQRSVPALERSLEYPDIQDRY